MKKRWFILLGLFFIVTPVKAFSCSYEDLSYYKKLAANVNVSYDYEEIDGTVTFTTTVVNLQPDFYIIDETTGKQYDYTGKEIKITGYHSGQSIPYKIYTTRNNCEQETLFTIRLTLPTYNPYYQDEVCAGLTDYNLCSRWSSHGLTYESFVTKVKKYRESLNTEPPSQPSEEEIPDNSIVQMFMRFLGKYYYVFLILIILGSSIGIYKLNKKDNMYY